MSRVVKKKKVVKHVTSDSIGGKNVELKHDETFSFQTEVPQEQNFTINGSLFHVEGIKKLKATAQNDELNIQTECGNVTIKCPVPGAYYIYKENTEVKVRVMTQEEVGKYAKVDQ